MSEQQAAAPPVTTAPTQKIPRDGRCHVCGGGSCPHWLNAVEIEVTAKHEDGKPYVGGAHIDGEALVAAHGIKPGDGPVLVGMEPKATASFSKNGGRVMPPRPKRKKGGRR